MNSFSTTDTIVAVATPPGRGGIGVIRIAGPDATRIAQTLVGRSAPLEPRHATLTRVLEPVRPVESGESPSAASAIDRVVLTWFAAPHSYTGDDVVEISAHGSPWLLHRVVELAVCAGARLAEPGEFTLRAYLNGRLDLVQAEAVADLVDAVTPLQARAAMDQLEGTLTSEIARLDSALFDLSARLEASLDFPDEGFHFIAVEETRRAIGGIRGQLAALAAAGRIGRVVREGRMVVIAGRPNAGKSSLFNALAGAARAIVTDVAGTTRDVLTERVDINGLAITLVDTAGLREARDPIEAEGVARARQAQGVAALTIVVLDRASPLTDEDRDVLAGIAAPRLIVASKGDLPKAWTQDVLGDGGAQLIEVSALTGVGLAHLRDRLVAALTGQEELRDPPAISNLRHLALVEEAQTALAHADLAMAAGATEELVLTDLGAARRALEAITGHRTPDDLLRHIFSKFCVGK